MPVVSVIVPVHNMEPYLRQCMDSIVNQTFKDIEIICVDDGSTDNSNAILKEYAAKDSRIKIIEHERAQGLSCARNAGLPIAKGEYISFIDSDDWMELDTYEKAVNAMSDNVDLVVWVAKFDYEAGYKDDMQFYDYIINKHKGGSFSLRDKHGLNVSVWNKLYRRSIIQGHNIIFPPGLLYEDNSFHAKYCVWCRDVVLLDDVLYHYRQRTGSIMDKDRKKSTGKTCDRMLNIYDFYLYLKEQNILSGQKPILRRLLRHQFRGDYANASEADRPKVFEKAVSLAREMQLGGLFVDRFTKKLIAGKMPNNTLSYLEQILYVSNEGDKKVISLLGFKMSFKRRRKASH